MGIDAPPFSFEEGAGTEVCFRERGCWKFLSSTLGLLEALLISLRMPLSIEALYVWERLWSVSQEGLAIETKDRHCAEVEVGIYSPPCYC